MNFKEISFWVIGTLTLIYCLVELAYGLSSHSLTLLSDGFHNLSDVISLYIAYWASKASRRKRSDEMSYGWKRTEILGALTNGIFLVSLAVYITLETIPEFFVPSAPPSGWVVIIIAFFGLAINTIATVVFHFTGQSHGHSHAGGGHGHSHGGGDDHGHSHGEEEEEDHGHSHSKKKKKHSEEISLIEDFHHSEEKKKKHSHSHGDKEGHGHSHGDDDGHGHGHGEKKKKEGHGHSHGDEDHGHGHGEKKKEGHGHSHGGDDDHGHGHGEKKKKEGHGHSHGGDDHGHAHGDAPKKKKVIDQNVRAVCLHYFGDMVSSFIVLVMGVVITVFPTGTWMDYVDPVTSLLIVLLILVTTLPLIKGCFLILLQRTPQHLNLTKLKTKILSLQGVLNVHDFHVWQLVDGMVITSLHIRVEESCDFNHISKKIKKLLHKFGIHSSAIQPEFVTTHHPEATSCLQNCVKNCEEDWCCKEEKPKEKPNELRNSGSKLLHSQIEPL